MDSKRRWRSRSAFAKYGWSKPDTGQRVYSPNKRRRGSRRILFTYDCEEDMLFRLDKYLPNTYIIFRIVQLYKIDMQMIDQRTILIVLLNRIYY